MKLIALVGGLAGLYLTTAAQAAPVTFSNRENVNVLNSDAVLFSAAPVGSQIGTPADLTGDHWTGAAYFVKGPNDGSNIAVTMDFGAGTQRNIQTLRNWDSFTGYNITAATVETSPNGSTWTTAPSSLAASGNNVTITLSSAVDTEYLRLTGTGYQANHQGSGNENWWSLGSLRAFGASGAGLDPGANIDLIANSGYGAGTHVTFTPDSGPVFANSGTNTFPEDNPTSLGGNYLGSYGNGTGAKFVFDRNIDFRRFGLMSQGANSTANYSILGSTDGGTTFPTTLYTATGGIANGPNFFDLTPFTGNALRFQVNSGGGSLVTTDFFAFQTVPEPGSLSLLALAAMTLAPRRRRQSR